jgi:hypothetical protein
MSHAIGFGTAMPTSCSRATLAPHLIMVTWPGRRRRSPAEGRELSDGTCRVGRVSAQDHAEATDAEATDTVTTASRHYLAAEHLWGAQDNARRARGHEGSLVGKVVFSPEHRACVSGSILLSVAFLEALVNEVFEDADDSVKKGAPNSRVASLGTRCLELMAESWAVSERGWSTPREISDVAVVC